LSFLRVAPISNDCDGSTIDVSTMRSGVIAALTTLLVSSLSACPGGAPSFTLTRKSLALRGHVRDAKGAPVARATVRAGERTTASRDDGSFELSDVPAGATLLEVEAPGFLPSVFTADTAHAFEGRLVDDSAVEVAFSGDVMFGRRYLDPAADGSHQNALIDPNDGKTAEALVRHVAPITRSADFMVPNVETAFAMSGTAHPGKPFVFLSPPSAVAGVVALGADVVSLANNHTYDFFEDGMRSTLEALHGAGVTTFGAGMDDTEAYRPVVLEKRGIRIGLTGFCGIRVCGVRHGDDDVPDQPPYQGASNDHGGVAKLDAPNVTPTLTELRAKADRVTVLVHGGIEYQSFPTSGQESAAHRALDLGADLVVGHHPHVMQAFESHEGKLVAYSLGNLVFDQELHETWPAVVLRVRYPKTAGPLSDFVVDPIYLEDYVPYPTSGGLARHIVRSLGEMSASRGVTILEEGTRGRVLLAKSADLPGHDASLTRAALADADGAGATMSLEDALVPGTYLASVSSAGDVLYGRDLLRFGSFEHELVDSPYSRISGFNERSDVQHITNDRPHDGERALEICRDYTTNDPSILYMAGRHPIGDDKTYSFCGCARGSDMSLATASIVYWDSIASDAKPIASIPVYDGAPPSEWSCFCKMTTPPAGAEFVNVQLQTKDSTKSNGCSGPDRELHCTSWDTLRLVEWEKADPKKPLPVPNAVDYVHTKNPGDVSVTLHTITPGEGSTGEVTP
jgi:poly-gamma-glutamate capsule biosynthesis protein CapA/YwtB (metallophosphatase superfamily)